MGGELSVIGLIKVSLEFVLSFTYDGGRDKAYGRATLTVKVEIAFFSTSVDITVERASGGKSGDPTFGQLFSSAETWSEYAEASRLSGIRRRQKMAISQMVLFTVMPRGISLNGSTLPVSVVASPRARRRRPARCLSRLRRLDAEAGDQRRAVHLPLRHPHRHRLHRHFSAAAALVAGAVQGRYLCA